MKAPMQHNHRALWSQSASRLWQLEYFQILACVYMQYRTYSHVLSLTSPFHFESIKLWLRVCFYPVAQFPTNNHLSLITFHLAPGLFFFLFWTNDRGEKLPKDFSDETSKRFRYWLERQPYHCPTLQTVADFLLVTSTLHFRNLTERVWCGNMHIQK